MTTIDEREDSRARLEAHAARIAELEERLQDAEARVRAETLRDAENTLRTMYSGGRAYADAAADLVAEVAAGWGRWDRVARGEDA